MLIRLKGKKFKNMLLDRQAVDEKDRPEHLITLGDTLWPEPVKLKIAQTFKDIGVENPMRQKLVEPYCRGFGGHDNYGEYDLENVNWEYLVDYFIWEASAWMADTEEDVKKHYKLVDKMKAKWGGPFSHYAAYQDGKGF